MSTPAARRAVGVLSLLSAGLVAARVLVPARIAAAGDSDLSDRQVLVTQVQDAFVAYWRSGASEYPPDLARVVDYWTRYHLVAAIITSALTLTLVALGVVLWRAFVAGDLSRRASGRAVASAGTAVWSGALVGVWMLTASIQAVAAPFGALLPLLHEGTPSTALSETVAQVRQQLDPAGPAGAPPPALAEVVDQYARFHVVHAVVAAPITLLLLGAAVVVWRRGARARRTIAVVWGCLALGFAVVCAANVATAADPEPGLLGFFEGGW